MRVIYTGIILILLSNLLHAQPEPRDGGICINYFSIFDQLYQHEMHIAQAESNNVRSLDKVMHIEHYLLKENSKSYNKSLPAFDPNDYFVTGLNVQNYTLFLPPHFNNIPAFGQRLICIIENDSMIIDFQHVPLLSTYEMLHMHTIQFMPGHYIVNLNLDKPEISANERDFKKAHAALRAGITTETLPILESLGVVQYTLPHDPKKHYNYITPSIRIEQTDYYTIRAIFNGRFEYTPNNVLHHNIAQLVDGKWENTIYQTYSYIFDQSGDSYTFQYLKDQVLPISDMEWDPFSRQALQAGIYRLVAFTGNGDSVVSEPFYFGIIPFDANAHILKLHPEGLGFPYYQFNDNNTINIETAQVGVQTDTTVVYTFNQYLERCDLCINEYDYEQIVGKSIEQDFFHRLTYNHLWINGNPFTGTAIFNYTLKGATVENGGQWFTQKMSIINTYAEGVLISTIER